MHPQKERAVITSAASPAYVLPFYKLRISSRTRLFIFSSNKKSLPMHTNFYYGFKQAQVQVRSSCDCVCYQFNVMCQCTNTQHERSNFLFGGNLEDSKGAKKEVASISYQISWRWDTGTTTTTTSPGSICCAACSAVVQRNRCQALFCLAANGS